ncbi:putative membrane protein [Clostridium aceticum]|uniref:Putative membrane protein n=1 Tax=Clostridium aceticum TaxID=84022 RepID=A0A0D8I5T3_9CLOT|nr:hypothetical protein [Clostridium aceticum]AKL97125.1 putative membrane protein [Clostridium aceticum]KJF25404.1 membrane protein [Clostridium aceticum]
MNKDIMNRFSPRRQKAYVSIFGTTQLHLRNPYVIAWWSAAFPGAGHMLLSKYLRGFLLFLWEVIVNIQSNLNLAILYSFIGRFDRAKEVLDTQWLLLYIATYIFAIWDGYRTAADINNYYVLAAREDAQITPQIVSAMEINYLDKRKPLVAAGWSFIMPGLGQLYIHRIVTAAFILIWWIVIMYFSKLLPAIHASFLGNFQEAKSIVDPQWLLNIPSVYMFAIYDAYVNTVENNKLFEWEQSKFLKRDYQSQNFPMPKRRKKSEGDPVYIISTFEHSVYLEMAITAIQMKGIPKEDIFAVPMDKRGEDRVLFDSMHFSDGLSLFDLPAILGAIFMLFGTIYGFILKWGPIWWALIGLAFGFSLGLIIKLIITKKYSNRQEKYRATEVVLIIQCKETQLETVKDTLWSHYALGVRKLDLE